MQDLTILWKIGVIPIVNAGFVPLYVKAVVKNTFSYYHCIVYSVRASNKTLPYAEIIHEIT